MSRLTNLISQARRRHGAKINVQKQHGQSWQAKTRYRVKSFLRHIAHGGGKESPNESESIATVNQVVGSETGDIGTADRFSKNSPQYDTVPQVPCNSHAETALLSDAQSGVIDVSSNLIGTSDDRCSTQATRPAARASYHKKQYSTVESTANSSHLDKLIPCASDSSLARVPAQAVGPQTLTPNALNNSPKTHIKDFVQHTQVPHTHEASSVDAMDPLSSASKSISVVHDDHQGAGRSSPNLPSPSDDNITSTRHRFERLSPYNSFDVEKDVEAESSADEDCDREWTSSEVSEDDEEDEYAGIDNTIPPVNGHFPPQPGRGPPADLHKEQHGRIKWVELGYPIPDAEWVIEPEIEWIRFTIKPHLHLLGLDHDDIAVEFFAEGSYHKLYTIRKALLEPGTGPEFIFRVCLPTYPWYKIESEIATMELVQMCTDIPIPKVYAYDSDFRNPMRHEWMLMDKVNGVPYGQAWTGMTMQKKHELARTLANWNHQLAKLRFDKIGSIYWDRKRPATSIGDFKVGPAIEQMFMFNWRLGYNIHRGPYTSIEQYLRALVIVNLAASLDPREQRRSKSFSITEELKDLETSPADYKDSDDRQMQEEVEKEWEGKTEERKKKILQLKEKLERIKQDASSTTDTVGLEEVRYRTRNFRRESLDPFTTIQKNCEALHYIIPNMCPQVGYLGENATSLHHWDISENNVLVDNNGDAVALVDWEQLKVLPYSLLKDYPTIIQGSDYDEPDPIDPKDEDDIDIMAPYLSNLEGWEKTLMRKTYRERLEELNSPLLRKMNEGERRNMEGVGGDESGKERMEKTLEDLLAMCRVADQQYIHSEVMQWLKEIKEEMERRFHLS